jgi:copper chaperone NosL
MNTQKISSLSRVILLVVGILFFVSLLFPMWQIELEAPQYPEGLILRLHANKIGGDVEIINGLNHYIGMKTLHTEDFFEFKIITYIVIFFGLFSLIAMIVAKRKLVVALLISLIAFVALAGIDFYRWNYEYGHNLDPNAAIKVPGMAYQPPVLGYKQLLNFGAYSIPDKGGWLLIAAGTLIFFVVIKETKLLSRLKRKSNASSAVVILLVSMLASCSSMEAQDLKINKDRCNFCEMTISDGRFGAEVITNKGRAFKFDDLICLLDYVHANKQEIAKFYVNDYGQNNKLIDATKAFFVESDALRSPMRGNIAAYENKKVAQDYADKVESFVMTWEDLLNR